MPQDESAWREVAKTFDKWDYPQCVGAMDGKHINLQAPIHSGSEYFNYKNFFSIVLFAVVDGNYNFIYANVGCQGRISDGGVFNAAHFKKCLDENKMHLPSTHVLSGQSEALPFVFVADDAFPLAVNVMKPFPGAHGKGSKERVFNYRLSRARRVSENVFGILTSVFRVLRKPMLLEPDTATKIVLAIIYLHNFLRKSSSKSIYNPPGTFDRECSDTGEISNGVWRRDESNFSGMRTMKKIARKSRIDAEDVRNKYAEYFISLEGSVPFQWNK